MSKSGGVPPSGSPGSVETGKRMSTRASKSQRAKRALRKSVENTLVHLPTIENYTKEVIFTAEGPGRVVAKVERLMGSDKIHYFDREWMGEFARVLDIDDARDLEDKSKMRADNERERSKKLALNMEMIPTAENDMEDIQNHPLYKVNLIMKKLEKLDLSALTEAKTKLPPIVPTEPFAEDFSGKIFESYPGHRKYDGGTEATLLFKNAEIVPSTTDTYFETEMGVQTEPDEEDDKEEEEAEQEAVLLDDGEGQDFDFDWGDVEGDDYRSHEKVMKKVAAVEAKMQQSLVDLMNDFNIETTDNIFILYSTYRSDVVEDLFGSEETFDKMYEMGKDINELYAREALKTEKELKALYRTIAQTSD